MTTTDFLILVAVFLLVGWALSTVLAVWLSSWMERRYLRKMMEQRMQEEASWERTQPMKQMGMPKTRALDPKAFENFRKTVETEWAPPWANMLGAEVVADQSPMPSTLQPTKPMQTVWCDCMASECWLRSPDGTFGTEPDGSPMKVTCTGMHAACRKWSAKKDTSGTEGPSA